MQEKKLTRAKIVIDALRGHYGEKVGEFAERLGVAGSTVSTWAKRDVLDEDLIFRKCKGVNFKFLQTGKGNVFEDEHGADVTEKEKPLESGLRRLVDQACNDLIAAAKTPKEELALIEDFLAFKRQWISKHEKDGT